MPKVAMPRANGTPERRRKMAATGSPAAKPEGTIHPAAKARIVSRKRSHVEIEWP